MAQAPYPSEREVRETIDDMDLAIDSLDSYMKARVVLVRAELPEYLPGIVHALAEIAELLGEPMKFNNSEITISRDQTRDELENKAIQERRWELQRIWREMNPE